MILYTSSHVSVWINPRVNMPHQMSLYDPPYESVCMTHHMILYACLTNKWLCMTHTQVLYDSHMSLYDSPRESVWLPYESVWLTKWVNMTHHMNLYDSPHESVWLNTWVCMTQHMSLYDSPHESVWLTTWVCMTHRCAAVSLKSAILCCVVSTTAFLVLSRTE